MLTDIERLAEATNDNGVHAMGINVSDMSLHDNESQIEHATLQKQLDLGLAERNLGQPIPACRRSEALLSPYTRSD
jgi:hypothetical protein